MVPAAAAEAAAAAEELLSRKTGIEDRLQELGVALEGPLSATSARTSAALAPKRSGRSASKASSKNTNNTEQPLSDADVKKKHLIPYVPKTDTHWDFVMKEMMWLGADFQAERKRQISLAKKISSSVKQFHKTKEARRLRELHQAEMKRRKLAARIGRDVRGWWNKIEKVISYKQKLLADEERQAAMNKQLVVLVQQTEKYTESLAQNAISEEEEDDEDFSGEETETAESSELDEKTDATSDSDTSGQRRRRRRRRRRMTIEEALAEEHSMVRKSKRKVIDYSRIKLTSNDFYGASTASDGSGSDGSFDPGDSSDRECDNDSTFQQAMHEELMLRHQDETSTFLADPEELRKLREEVTMDVYDVLERLREEGEQDPMEVDPSTHVTHVLANRTKQVHFSGTIEEKEISLVSNKARKTAARQPVGKYDADDDADASDVEDYVETEEISDEEFEAQESEADDETTMEQEEALPPEITASDEIAMLKREGDLPIDELRKLYAKIDQSDEDSKEEDSAAKSAGFDEDRHSVSPSRPESRPKRNRRGTGYSNANHQGNNSASVASLTSGNVSSEGVGSEDEGEEEFELSDQAEAVDDETTIAAEEKLGRDMSYEDEIVLLKEESEMSVDELRAKYLALDSAAHDDGHESLEPPSDAVKDEIDREEEFQPDEMEVDDEATLEAEEKLGREMSHDEEMELLKRESEIPVEELRAMYARMEETEDRGKSGGTEAAPPIEDREKASLISQLYGQPQEHEDEDEFAPDEAEAVDDETTIDAEERLGRDITPQEEVALLQRENEIPVEELRKMYANMEEKDGSASSDEEMVDPSKEGVGYGTNKRKRNKTSDDSDSDPKKARTKLPTDDALVALNALEASAQRAQQTLASRPFLLAGWVKLRHYQQVGLNWLVSLQSRRLNGILADEMGLGKTLQTIALFAYLASYKGIWGPHLIVVPTSVIINWETELKRFCPAFKVLCYYGSAKRRKELRQGWTKTNWYHVVITSYQLAVQDAFAFKRKKWYYLVLDEAQNIKNFQSQRWQTLINFNTQRRLLLTGTPLQNNLMELWSLLHFLMPYIFRSRKEFSYWFSNPMTDMIEGNGSRNEDVMKRLHGIIRPFVLRRLKKDVEKQMPGKFEHIVKCQLSRRQMTLYEEFLSRSSTRMALKKDGNFMGMMNVLMQLRKVCNHPDLFEPRSIITPLVLPGISITVPSFVCSEVLSKSVLDNVSRQWIEPLWCGPGGLPSIDAALRCDAIEAEQLGRMRSKLKLDFPLVGEVNDSECPDELKELLCQIHNLRKQKAEANIRFRNEINDKRCRAPPFVYPQSLLDSLRIECGSIGHDKPVEVRGKKVALTPQALLDMRKTEGERAYSMDDIIGKFTFCIPPAGGDAPVLDSGKHVRALPNIPTKDLDEMLLEPLEELLEPYQKAQARLSAFFPDKKLVQFDAGKLQTLAELLHNLKRGGHRCLIFTQMSKMLDILEAFLNLNGHTYLRLDGATGVDKRQRYMDRFNNDEKLFCFILSTRSGGMGINLTGADTVIFYDSDWNPAMDAQAQDRAHRIGQTRDVHIYRLITEHTIEENILLKAKQKKNLDKMVMDQGKFDASHQGTSGGSADKQEEAGDEMKDVYTKGGLRAILGVEDEQIEADTREVSESGEDGKDMSNMSKEQMEMAMAALEDEDDVKALRGAQKEAAEELQEFDENAEIKKDSDGDDDDDETNEKKSQPKKKQKKSAPKVAAAVEEPEKVENEQSELEKEFAAWQTSVGFDAKAIEASLTPMERYGMSFRETIDPFYSVFYINEMRRKAEASETYDEIDIEAIEREKAIEERRAIEDGDLLATRPRPENLVRQRNMYRREKARLRSDKKRRKITGENWVQRVDGLTKGLFWYNEDTGEAIWDTPPIIIELQAEAAASKMGWSALQTKILVSVMEYLAPYPDRQKCALVCRQWKVAAHDFRFIRHIYPVEMGALSRDLNRRDHNHFGSIEEALSIALPGDTIELSDGHYWLTDGGLAFDKPLKLIGDENNPANVVIEMSGSVQWTGHGGFIEGVTFRRPQIASTELPDFPMLLIEGKGRVDMIHSVLDNEGSQGSVVVAKGGGPKGTWQNVTLRNGGWHGIEISGEGASIELTETIIRGCQSSGIHCTEKADFTFKEGKIHHNSHYGIVLTNGASGTVVKSRFFENGSGTLQRETGCNLTASMNVGIVKRPPKKGIPGFRLMTKGQEEAEKKQAAQEHNEAKD